MILGEERYLVYWKAHIFATYVELVLQMLATEIFDKHNNMLLISTGAHFGLVLISFPDYAFPITHLICKKLAT